MDRNQFTIPTPRSWVVAVCVAILAASPAMAIVGGTSDTSAFTDPGSYYYGLSLDGIARARSGSAVAISNRHLLLADHFSLSVGNTITLADGSTRTVTDLYHGLRDGANNMPVDLKIVKVDADMDTWYDIYDTGSAVDYYGHDLVMAGTGYDGDTYPNNRFMWDEVNSTRDWRWGTNWLSTETSFAYSAYESTVLGLNYDYGQTIYEAGLGMGDSGSGVFFKDGDEWKLVGINAYVYTRVRQYDTSYAVSIPHYLDWIESIVPTGDLDNNDVLDVNDIDQLLDLLAALGGQPTPEGYELYDVNSDDMLSLADAVFLVESMMGYIYGDLNLDGTVDAGDLALLAANFGQIGDWGWSDGDVNGDGIIDAGDLALIATNFGETAPGVPEPMTLSLLGAGGLALLRRKRR